MNGEERRREILNIIRQSDKPVSGAKLAEKFEVSRQVVVQDIALIRAAGKNVISTNRGYVLTEADSPERVFKINHSDEEMEDELTSIIDLGGTVRDVFVWHRIYGKVQADLEIDSRLKIRKFLDGIESGKSSPLKNITSGYHYHTVAAEDDATLDLIRDMLQEKGYLVEEDE